MAVRDVVGSSPTVCGRERSSSSSSSSWSRWPMERALFLVFKAVRLTAPIYFGLLYLSQKINNDLSNKSVAVGGVVGKPGTD